jgi:antitoxin ParD1/3/4
MNMNVSLTDELGEFVNAKVSSGRYTSASEVVREALRLMERHEQIEAAKLQWLREAYQAGLASGDAGELDMAAVKAEARKLSKSKSP